MLFIILAKTIHLMSDHAQLLFNYWTNKTSSIKQICTAKGGFCGNTLYMHPRWLQYMDGLL